MKLGHGMQTKREPVDSLNLINDTVLVTVRFLAVMFYL